jgi:hypothetical protein
MISGTLVILSVDPRLPSSSSYSFRLSSSARVS